MNINDLEKELNIKPIWRQAFRPFFLFACIFAVLALSAWALVLEGKLSFSPYGGLTFWHSHEMLFGFVAAIIAGFLLTAVQNWTGLRATNGKSLVGLFLLWLAGRVLMLVAPTQWAYLVVVTDVSFLMMTAWLLARLLLKVKQYRNLIFIPVLVLLAATNILTHMSVIKGDTSWFTWGSYTAVMLVTLMMTIVAGRVMPMFTANGTLTKKVENIPWLERLVIGSTILIVAIYLLQLNTIMPKTWLALVLSVASASHGVRVLRWKPWVTLSTPLVWSLHLAYWFIPVSLALFALHFAGFAISASSALHGLTAGAMSCLILAMIARISLGHSGRPLHPHWSLSYAFGLIVIAGICRFLAANISIDWPLSLYTVSAVMWSLAYTIYLVVYVPILTSPRPDGRPG